MTNTNYNSSNNHLQVDNTNIALMKLYESIKELERLICLEKNDCLNLAIEHRNLLDLYQSEVKRQENFNPQSTPYDW